MSGSSLHDDPEFAALKAEFLASLAERRQGLADCGDFWLTPAFDPRPFIAVAHKLAGSAGSYGFDSLSRISGWIDRVARAAVEDPLFAGRIHALSRWPEWRALLDEIMLETISTGRDPVDYESDPRATRLKAEDESLSTKS